jgi:hypothetical protein
MPHGGNESRNDDSNPYNGYFWDDGNWVPGLISYETWFTPIPYYSYGNAVFYAPHLMRATAEQRGFSLEGYVDGVALLSPADIGRTVWMRRPGHEWEGPYLAVDCAQRADMWGTAVHRGEIVEVSFDTALRWGMVRLTATGWRTNYWREPGVEVLVANELPDWAAQPEAGLRRPGLVNYPDWWHQRVGFATWLTEPAHSPLARGPGIWRWHDGRTISWDVMYDQPWLNGEEHRPPAIPLLMQKREGYMRAE